MTLKDFTESYKNKLLNALRDGIVLTNKYNPLSKLTLEFGMDPVTLRTHSKELQIRVRVLERLLLATGIVTEEELETEFMKSLQEEIKQLELQLTKETGTQIKLIK